MSVETERLHNLHKLAIKEERRLLQLGVVFRMVRDKGYFELRTNDYVYFVHPNQIDIGSIKGGTVETIYKKKFFGSILTGIEKGFASYTFRGSAEGKRVHDEIKRLVVLGFDLRKIH